MNVLMRAIHSDSHPEQDDDVIVLYFQPGVSGPMFFIFIFLLREGDSTDRRSACPSHPTCMVQMLVKVRDDARNLIGIFEQFFAVAPMSSFGEMR